ncbi:hypothetical protein QR680_000415 [Steinernema hermaphroditum]|uniref:Ig-like domain-containing protein n=1 Tax=Steinernema hermaphroditum TaxID=289476 RepID=A0AA39GVD2_9BILA|nr:hypothetical protein QR680_000415 [Steinernema hermaphroditum]
MTSIFLIALLAACVVAQESQERKPARERIANEMLVPRHSTTALMCEPIFAVDSDERAVGLWYKDRKLVARVTRTQNAVLDNRTYHADQPVPDVGFLIITNASLNDEGVYHCEREDTRAKSEYYKIAVAYVDIFQPETKPVFYPTDIHLLDTVSIACPQTHAVPEPAISWKMNGESINRLGNRVEVLQNGTLVIKKFDTLDIGEYECTMANFAGTTSTKIFVTLSHADHAREDLFGYPTYGCSGQLRNGLLWFLIGCLATSSCVLVYLLASIMCIRKRRFAYPSLLFQTADLAPGFRKVIAPLNPYEAHQRDIDPAYEV